MVKIKVHVHQNLHNHVLELYTALLNPEYHKNLIIHWKLYLLLYRHYNFLFQLHKWNLNFNFMDIININQQVKGYGLQLQNFHLEELYSVEHHQYPCNLHKPEAKYLVRYSIVQT